VTISSVQTAVLDKARAEAEAILAEARKEADARFEREAARLREEHERRVAAIRAEAEAKLEREAGNRRAEDRNKLLAMKNEIIEEVFAKAIENIRDLPDDGYAKWLKAQRARAPRMDGAVVAVNEADRPVMENILGQNSGLKMAEKSAPIRGGMIIRGPRADLDFSIESLLGVLRESLAGQIAAQLFAEPKKDES